MRTQVKSYQQLLMQSALFSPLTEEELHHLLQCLDAHTTLYTSNQFIIRETDSVDTLGIVLEGEVQVLTDDALGNRSITAVFGPGEVFGQVSASKLAHISPVAVMAVNDCNILHLKFSKLVRPCSRACPFHSRVIYNMMNVLADRNLMMNRKLSIVSQRTIREKLLAYLAWQSQDHDSKTFTIPFNRDELADYLCVNRSALSREISHMCHEGLIQTERNRFTIVKDQESAQIR
jgi:CRP-like cAMP-binding protein